MYGRKYSFNILSVTNDSGGQDLYCSNLDTSVSHSCYPADGRQTLYYCEASPTNDVLTIREWHDSGPIIATADICQDKEGITEIEFNEQKITIQLRHGYHQVPRIHTATSFAYNGSGFWWERHSELYRKDRDDSTLIAIFYPSSASERVGTIEVICDGERMSGMTIITSMILLKRAEGEVDTLSSS